MFPAITAENKTEAIRTMVGHLADSRGITEVEPLVRAVLEREQKDSTGLEHGVAVPHGKTDAVTDLIAGVATVRPPVDFSSRDGAPTEILVMTISPLHRSGPHLQFIGEVVRLLRDQDLRAALLAAGTPEEMLKAVLS